VTPGRRGRGTPSRERPRAPAAGRGRGWSGLLAAGALAPIALVGVLTLGGPGTGGRAMPDEGQHHVPEGITVTYGHVPPTSGAHWPQPARWGYHETPLPPERWVHNLEHGGLVVLYHCPGACPELVRQLREAHGTFPPSKWGHVKLLVTPNAQIRTPLAVLAWAWLDELDGFDQGRLLAAYRARVDRGPEDLP